MNMAVSPISHTPAHLDNNSGARTHTVQFGDMLSALAVQFGIPLEDAVRACTYNPAQSIGIDNRAGTLDEGKEASFVLLDETDLSVRAVVFKGVCVEG